MKPKANNRPVIVGFFILFGLAILLITVLTLGGQKETFIKSFALNALFKDVGGLSVGGNIWLSGVKVGIVKKISFYGDSQVLVTMNIEKIAQSHIHQDAKVKIGADGLIGNKNVIIYDGNISSPQVEKGDFLQSGTSLTTNDMMATLQENNKNLLEITKDFRSIAQKINNGKGTLATLLNDPTMANRLEDAVRHLQVSTANIADISKESKGIIGDLKSFSGQINKKGNSINELVSDTTIYKSVKATLSQLNIASIEIAKFTTQLKNTSNQLTQKDNAVGVLLNDSETALSIKTTLKNLESSSKKLDEDLEALQHNILLRRFFKKKEKL